MSADVGDVLLVFCLGSSLRLLRGERENGCILPFTKSRQQHGLAIGELERVMIDVKRALVDLAKDRIGLLLLLLQQFLPIWTYVSPSLPLLRTAQRAPVLGATVWW
jgi:hypothetical protein